MPTVRITTGGIAFALSFCLMHAAAADGAPPLLPGAKPARSCESLRELKLADTQVTEALAIAGASSWCRLTAVVSYPSGDKFTVWVGLPDQWNGRFQGQGGGGFMAGSPDSLTAQVLKGYATAATDAGVERTGTKPPVADGSFALDPRGHLNWNLIRDFAHRGIHEMTVTGKAITQAYYAQPAARAYFSGCSTGGRQGQMEAQRYPDDYDGILSGAPAVNWTKLHIAQMWGQLQMREANHVVGNCKLAAATAAAVSACDAADGVTDGIISAPRQCAYDPQGLVGTNAGACGEFTAADAEIIRKIWAGPKSQSGDWLWYGAQRGADLSALNGADAAAHDAIPFPISLEWWRYFLAENPGWDWHDLSAVSYAQFWHQSVEEYPVIATDSADLSAFQRHGGKTLLWHGDADQLIYPQGTIDYFERIQAQAGGAKVADKFVRLFMAPGVAHCGGGAGPEPVGQLDALVNWVERGVRPDTILAESRDKQGRLIRSRPLCPYPTMAIYQGRGSSDEARNFKCGMAPKS